MSITMSKNTGIFTQTLVATKYNVDINKKFITVYQTFN